MKTSKRTVILCHFFPSISIDFHFPQVEFPICKLKGQNGKSSTRRNLFCKWSYYTPRTEGIMFLTHPPVSQSVSPVFLVRATPLKPLNRISWNLVVMKDIMCRFAFLQEMLIWSFSGAIHIPFELCPKLFCATQMKLVFCQIARH